jgi:hypothetical protein
MRNATLVLRTTLAIVVLFCLDNVGLPAIASVPEPSSVTLGILGFVGVIGFAVRHKSR